MKRLLCSTAVALIALSSAIHAAPVTYLQAQAEGDVLGTDMMGRRVFATPQALPADAVKTTPPATGWEDIGEVGDLVLTRDGKVSAVLVEVGGFLGIGEKTVAVPMSDIHFVRDGTHANSFVVTIASSRAEIEAAPSFTKTLRERADEMTKAVGASVAEATKPSPVREGYTPILRQDLTAERLTGATVYGPDDKQIGHIGALVLDAGGQITQAVIDVGGFLGMGARPVALPYADLDVLMNAKNSEIRVFVKQTPQALKALPVYEG